MADETPEWVVPELLLAAVEKARQAASGDSNDDEIDALQAALVLALARWPEVPEYDV